MLSNPLSHYTFRPVVSEVYNFLKLERFYLSGPLNHSGILLLIGIENICAYISIAIFTKKRIVNTTKKLFSINSFEKSNIVEDKTNKNTNS